MGRLSDASIRSWIKCGERFEGRCDGEGLYLRFRAANAVPRWLFRYQFAGKPRVLHMGSYSSLSLADARRTAKEMRARVALGFDVAEEKRGRKREAVAKIESARRAMTVSSLADEYFAERVLGRWKHPNIVRSRIERDIKPNIGRLALGDVRPTHIDEMLKAIVRRGAPTMATDVLRWVKRMFDYAVKRELMASNPASAFDPSDAGGKEEPRERWLAREELVQLFEVMRTARGWTHENTLLVKLLLMLGNRKSEVIEAPIAEFDIDASVWRLPAARTKTGTAIDIPLPGQAVSVVQELIRLGEGSLWLLPARKMQTRMRPYIDLNTVNAAMAKCVRPLMSNREPFTLHDLRRTMRTHLEALGISPHVAERCLNHKLRGVLGVYNRHDYFDERRDALQRWADVLEDLEAGRVS